MAINETKIKNDISAQVQNQIAQQRQSINNTLNIQKGQYDETINRNQSYLNEQIGKLKTDKNINDDKIATLQNRRGGFYSGGMDYQLGENLKANQGAQTAITRDINDKNNSVLGEYNTLARQAAENIRSLETQAPDKIRELVNAELSRQRQVEFEREQFEWQKKLAQQQEQLRREQFEFQKKMEEQQFALSKAKASGGGSRSGSSRSSSSGSSAQAVVQAALKEINDSIHVKMGNSSPKLDPKATTGLASKPGSYWYARGYGSQYTPNNYYDRTRARVETR